MVDTSIAPYFDDFDEKKNFAKILFNPRRAVQVRELNQIQTMLQSQIERFGRHVFDNGSLVIPGEVNYDLNYEYVSVVNLSYADVVGILETNAVTITGVQSGVVADVVQHVGNTASDPVTFYIQYKSGNESDSSRFVDGEGLRFTTATGTEFAAATALTTGQGSVLTVSAGIFYLNGSFIRTEDSRAVLSKYSNRPSVSAGFRLHEDVVTWTSDESLLDNSAGTTNYTAIGADRLRQRLVLEVHEDGAAFDAENYIEVVKFIDGVLQRKVKTSAYNVLEDTLARRTYDESGDYTVKPFNIHIMEHLKDGSNRGLYEAPEGDESKFVIGVEPGKAYVRGYEVENLATRYVENDKARATGFQNNAAFSMPVGNYIIVGNANILPRSDAFQRITFYSGVPSTAGAIPAGTVLGTARVRTVRRAGTKLHIYLFDVRNAAGKTDSSFVTTAKSVYSAGSTAFTANVESELIDSINHGLVFALPFNNVKTLLNSGVSDTTFNVLRQYTAVADANGVVTLTAGSTEVFATPSAASVASYTASGTSVTREIASIASLSGVPVGKSLVINLGAAVASATVTAVVEVVKQTAVQKIKTLNTATVTLSAAEFVNGRFNLGKADVQRVKSIVSNGVNKTSKYRLVKNVNKEFYGLSYVELNPGEATPNASVTIEFEYFVHSNGDFFSVDSYTSIDYGDIPEETIDGVKISLSDVIDFRPCINSTGDGYSGAGSSFTEVPTPYSILRCDVEHYLPRIDKLYVSADGKFGIAKGVPSLTPAEPKSPDNAMVIYNIFVPAYTKSASDVQSSFINNRRYTMRDIGKLEDRIANVEYYTTLSLLETEANAMQIVDDATGLNRFKNGFVTDAFKNYSVGAATLSDFQCAIAGGIMRPQFGTDFVDLELNANYSSGVQRTGSLVTLPYTEVKFLSQELASDVLNVNPYAVYRWNGTLSLTPNTDVWFENQIVSSSSASQTVGNWVDETPTVTFTRFLGDQAFTSTDFNSHVLAHDRVGQATTTVTQNVARTQTSVSTYLVGTQDIPFMRTREVKFVGKGLMPYSRAYAFFDNVNVSAHCRQEGKTYGAPMFVDEKGNIEGVFRIPNNSDMRFRTGTKQFTLIDDLENERETSLSYAGTNYTAQGTLNLMGQNVVTTTIVEQVTQESVVPWDPLAQSFFVEKSGGVFVTSLELFFKTKDKSLPVSVQIRDMQAGVPGKNIIPYSTVTLEPDQVNVSETGTVATKFVFDSPVYLNDGAEYCFVVMSNSNNYTAFIATMGRPALNTKTAIAKQPAIGVLFKSQNNSTWTEDQMSDMKFRLNAAKFQVDTIGKAGLAAKSPAAVKLVANSLRATAGSDLIKVVVPNHNFFEGSRFSITGVDLAPGISLSDLNRVHVVQAVNGPDEVTIRVANAANETGSFGGANVVVERNAGINLMRPTVQQLIFDQTNVEWKYEGTTGKSLSGNETPYLKTAEASVTVNANNAVSVPHVIPCSSDVEGRFTRPAALLNGYMVTFVDNLSPVIDLNRVGIMTVANRINSPASLNETAANGGNAVARYMTKVVGLKNAAESLKMFIDANKPVGADIKVFFRTGNTEQEVNENVWSEMNARVSATSPDMFTFTEFEFSKDGLALFSFYQFKIVMTSTSSSNVPQLMRLRGIALGT